MTALSVVIASHNAAGTLRDQLDALLAQAWPDGGEIVVADNRSTDTTPELLARYADAVVPVRRVAVDDEAGAAYARNAAVPHASFEAIAFCDADDVVGPGWIAAMSDALESHPFVGGPLEYDRLNPSWLANARGRHLDPAEQARFEGSFAIVSSCNMGVHRAVFELVGGFDARFERVEDAELSLRLDRMGIVAVHRPDAVVHYRMRSTMASVFAQSRSWGRQIPLLRRSVGDAAVRTVGQRVRSWAWLVANLPGQANRGRRAHWMHVAGTRVGSIEGRLIHGVGSS